MQSQVNTLRTLHISVQHPSMLPNFKSHSQKLLGHSFAPQDPLYFYHLHHHLHSVPIGLSEALSKDGSHLIAVASWADMGHLKGVTLELCCYKASS